MKIKAVFLDTNVYLHCESPEQVDWLEVLGGERVEIVVPSITFTELDDKKDSHPKPHLKKRARARLVQLDGWLDGDRQVRKGVTIRDYGYPQSEMFEGNGLVERRNDDVLIATMLQYQAEHPEHEVILVAHDSGPRRTAKRLGLEAVKLPEAYELPPERDPVQKENEQLKQKVQRLENAFPKLSLGFSTKNGFKEWLEVSVHQVAPLNETYVQQKMNAIKEWNAPMVFPDPAHDSNRGSRVRLDELDDLRSQLLSMTYDQEDIVEYNKELKAFYAEYEQSLVDVHRDEVRKGLTVAIDLVLDNSGTKPAEDIDVWLHFPDGFTLFREGELPASSKLPAAPVKPRTKVEKLAMPDIRSLLGVRPNFEIPTAPYIGDYTPSNVSSFAIKKTKSYDVNLHVRRVKHGVPEKLGQLYVMFDDYESASNFPIDYELKAANLPDPVVGKLHVKVKKVDHEQ